MKMWRVNWKISNLYLLLHFKTYTVPEVYWRLTGVLECLFFVNELANQFSTSY